MDRVDVELLGRIVDHAAAASTDPDRWKHLVKDVNELFAARNTVLFTPEPAPDIQPLGITYGDLADGMDDYFANWAHQDVWLKAVAGTQFFQTAGEARFTHEFLADKELTKTAFFNDWSQRYSAEQALALKVTDSHDPSAPVMHLTLFRRLGDAAFTRQDQTLLRLLWPHLQQAAQTHWALQSVRQSKCAVEAALDVIATPLWIVREDAHIEYANAAAFQLMCAGDWVSVQQGHLRAVGHLDADALRAHIKADNGIVSSAKRAQVVSAKSNGQLRRGMLRIVPVVETILYVRAWPRAHVLVMLEIAPSADDNLLWMNYLTSSFRLTNTQRLILERLSQGMSVERISLLQGIKVGTVRAHVHELLCKTGQTTQADLVRLVLGR